MPYKQWVVGEEVLAADFNTFVQKQVVATFANAAARDAAIPSPNAGMLVYLADLDMVQRYTGTQWRNLPSGMPSSYAQLTANSGNVGNTPLVTPGLTVGPLTATAGHRWKLTVGLTVAQTAAGPSLVRPHIREGATQIAGTFHRVENGGFYCIMFGAVIAPTTGPHTYDVFMSTDVGTANIQASALQPSWFLVEDIG